MSRCSEPGCDGSVSARGLCHKHYQRRLRAYGNGLTNNAPAPVSYPSWEKRKRKREKRKRKRSCSVPGCQGWHWRKGLCFEHSRRDRPIGNHVCSAEVEVAPDLRFIKVCVVCRQIMGEPYGERRNDEVARPDPWARNVDDGGQDTGVI